MTDFKQMSIDLWQIIDDIDTYSDLAKDNDKMYRSLIVAKVKERFGIMKSDGYSLFNTDGEVVDYHEGSDWIPPPLDEIDRSLSHGGDCEDGTSI